MLTLCLVVVGLWLFVDLYWRSRGAGRRSC